ncbi:MAG: hypothetical protein ACE5LD_00245 [Candidatus Bipolaricaulia bacterium]
MMKRYSTASLLISLSILLALSALHGRADQDPAVLIAQAEQLFDRWDGEGFDFAAYEGRLRQAIGLWEEALPLIPADQIQTVI